MKWLQKMRVVFAGLFIFVGMIAGLGLVSHFFGDNFPIWVMVLLIGLYLPVVFAMAYFLFNVGAPRPWSPTQADIARKLDEQGLLTRETLKAARVFDVSDFDDDEGPNYFLELEDGGVLFLTGFYLYRLRPSVESTGTFPCTEFTLQRDKVKGQVVDIVCAGVPLPPVVISAPLYDVDFKPGAVPADGEIIRDRTYDELMATISQAVAK